MHRPQIPELLLAAASMLLVLLLAEAMARLWVGHSWPAAKTLQLTHATETRGRFTRDLEVGYWLTPDFEAPGFRHDERGFRSPPFAIPKPLRTHRIVMMGASTVYGISVEDHQTSSTRLREELGRRHPAETFEVINAGVSGWTSRETVLNLASRIRVLDPDVVVMLDGRNEIFPQLWNDYRDDYSHYRVLDYDLRRSNLPFKRLFWVSHLAMLVLTRGHGHLGFSAGAEHPVYGSIQWSRRPDDEELVTNAGRPEIGDRFEANLRRFVAAGRAMGALPVLATIPFRTEGFASNVIGRKTERMPVLEARVLANNDLTRRIAVETASPLADLFVLREEKWLVDDCHFSPAGEFEVARILADAIGPILFGAGER